jgi:selenium metabolism protein YedF
MTHSPNDPMNSDPMNSDPMNSDPMNPAPEIVDARGLASPQPVILTRQALADGREWLEVLVDSAAARENVVRFAGFAHCAVEAVDREGEVQRIRIRAGAAVEPAAPAGRSFEPAPLPGAMPPSVQGTTVLITGAGIGRGDDQLGSLLLRACLDALTGTEPAPRRIVLMHGGVRLAVAGAEALGNLRRLEARGMEILVCGTSLAFYQLQEQLAVGRIASLPEIAGFMLQGRTVSL